MQRFRVLLLLLCLFPGVAFAQVHQFDLDGDFLSRGELRVGGNEAGSETAEGDFAAFILGRSRLSAHYRLLSDSDYSVPASGMLGVQRHEVVKGFSSLYGSRHKFYGAMDFFYLSAYYGGFTPGLQNAFAGVTWKPLPALTADLAYHFLATAAKLRNAEQPLGHELEASFSYDFGHGMSLGVGYSFMRGTETMVVLKRTSEKRELHWGWLMFRFAPRFLQSRR